MKSLLKARWFKATGTPLAEVKQRCLNVDKFKARETSVKEAEREVEGASGRLVAREKEREIETSTTRPAAFRSSGFDHRVPPLCSPVPLQQQQQRYQRDEEREMGWKEKEMWRTRWKDKRGRTGGKEEEEGGISQAASQPASPSVKPRRTWLLRQAERDSTVVERGLAVAGRQAGRQQQQRRRGILLNDSGANIARGNIKNVPWDSVGLEEVWSQKRCWHPPPPRLPRNT
ncbi:hypothetical protein WH47_08216 [Habropoda laboriosa]|uniref:Uncharacterized protein n=1 Tax=Habropoda laboriosa TaxID=597456 RepID=A0A0L7RGH0_9HYME|nr:hypothetical protein WH47_08216 [Habropoda laboriosa]